MTRMLSGKNRIAIAGASLGGLRVAQALRKNAFDGEVLLIGEEHELPYDRPPLSKSVSSSDVRAAVSLCTAKDLDDLDIKLQLGARAVAADDGCLTLNNHAVIAFDHLVIATGARSRRVPDQPADARCVTLRTLQDSARLNAQLAAAKSMVIVGGGFIGSEVASMAVAQGIKVTVLDAATLPGAAALGAPLAQIVAQRHRDHGVELRYGHLSSQFVPEPGGIGVRLENGEILIADVMLIAVGSVPNNEWLSADLEVSLPTGIPCNDSGSVLGHPTWSAVGDVSAWLNPLFGDRRRIEHWSSAGEQAELVAARLTGRSLSRRSLDAPYVWSDQHKSRIQIVGRPDLSINTLPYRQRENPDSIVHCLTDARRLVGAAAIDAPRAIPRLRRLIGQHPDEAVDLLQRQGYEAEANAESL